MGNKEGGEDWKEGSITLSVIWPATPSSKPYLPKMRKAAASRPFRYSRSLYLSSNLGGLGNDKAPSLASTSETPTSCGTAVLSFVPVAASVAVVVVVADGGDMLRKYYVGAALICVMVLGGV